MRGGRVIAFIFLKLLELKVPLRLLGFTVIRGYKVDAPRMLCVMCSTNICTPIQCLDFSLFVAYLLVVCFSNLQKAKRPFPHEYIQ